MNKTLFENAVEAATFGDLFLELSGYCDAIRFRPSGDGWFLTCFHGDTSVLDQFGTDGVHLSAEIRAALKKQRIDSKDGSSGVRYGTAQRGTVYLSSFEAPNMLWLISAAVNYYRLKQGKESLEEEAVRLWKEDQERGALPLIYCGPEAACHCGSKKPLVLSMQRKYTVLVPWNGALPFWETQEDVRTEPRPGEIGTCPDCGKSYKLSA